MKRQSLRVVLRIPAQKVSCLACTTLLKMGRCCGLESAAAVCRRFPGLDGWESVGWAPAQRRMLLWEDLGIPMELDVFCPLMLSLKTF